jgi:hypothetical protein
MRHGLAGQRRGRGATRIRASSWWVIRRSGSGLRAARSVSMRCGCGRCVVRPPCQRSDGCRLSPIKAPFTRARERDSMRHTKLQSQAWPSTSKLDDDAQRSSPPPHSRPYLSLDRSRLRLFLRGKSERAAWTIVLFCAIDRGGVSPVKTTGADGVSGPSCEGGRFSRVLQTVGDRLNQSAKVAGVLPIPC